MADRGPFDLWIFTATDTYGATEPHGAQTPDYELASYEFVPSDPIPEPGPDPDPEPEVPDPQNPTPAFPQEVLLGRAIEYYEDYGSGFNHRPLSILGFQESLVYFKTRIRPMTAMTDFIIILEVFSTEFIPSPNRLIVEHTVAISEDISQEAIRPQNSDAVVGELITFNIESVRSLSETLVIQEFLTAYLVANQWINPGVGAPGSANTLTLTSAMGTVQLRNPKLGDTSAYTEERVQRNTRGNDLIIYRDDMWPFKEVLHFEFEYLSSTQAAQLLDFMHDSLGMKIDMIDQYNRSWEGYILTPEAEIIQNKRIGFGAQFDFQGTLS